MTGFQNQHGAGAVGALDADRLSAWIDAAQPNARLVYYHGRFAGEGPRDLNEALLAAESRGFVYLVQDFRSADFDGHDYLAIRSSRPAGDQGRPQRPRSIGDQAHALFDNGGRGRRSLK